MDESKYTDGFIWSVGPVFNSSEKRLAADHDKDQPRDARGDYRVDPAPVGQSFFFFEVRGANWLVRRDRGHAVRNATQTAHEQHRLLPNWSNSPE
jgi:hypothetical protein